jgi:hypothetical protein
MDITEQAITQHIDILKLQSENAKMRRLIKAMAKYLGQDSLSVWEARQLWVRANNILAGRKVAK